MVLVSQFQFEIKMSIMKPIIKPIGSVRNLIEISKNMIFDHTR